MVPDEAHGYCMERRLVPPVSSRCAAPDPLSVARLAQELGIALRWLPVACPELNPADDLWRHVKQDVLANEGTPDWDASLGGTCEYILWTRQTSGRSLSRLVPPELVLVWELRRAVFHTAAL